MHYRCPRESENNYSPRGVELRARGNVLFPLCYSKGSAGLPSSPRISVLSMVYMVYVHSHLCLHCFLSGPISF